MSISRLIHVIVVTASILLLLTLWLVLRLPEESVTGNSDTRPVYGHWLMPFMALISLMNGFAALWLAKSLPSEIRQFSKLPEKKHSQTEDQALTDIKDRQADKPEDVLQALKEIHVPNMQISQNLLAIINKKTAALEKAQDELTQFAYRASHDLKSPLSSSKALSKLITEDIDAGELEEAKLNSQKIYQQINRLENIVGDIINFAKADLTLEDKKEIDFLTIVEGVKKQLAWLLRDADCELISEIDLQKPIYSEKSRVSQVVENLVANSIKYRDTEKPHCFVKVSARNEASELVITVEDNGLGIPKEKHAEVFKLFKKFHPGKSFGSGLGLSIIYKQVTHLGGKIHFESSEKGTVFTIRIPETHPDH